MCMLGGGGMSVCFLYMHRLVHAWRPGEDWTFYSITLHLIPLRQDLSHWPWSWAAASKLQWLSQCYIGVTDICVTSPSFSLEFWRFKLRSSLVFTEQSLYYILNGSFHLNICQTEIGSRMFLSHKMWLLNIWSMTVKDKGVKMFVIYVDLEEVLSEKKTKFPGKAKETP